MSFNYNQILNIPERCLLNKRLTKAFFLKNFDLSGTEKKLLNSIINERTIKINEIILNFYNN